MKPPLVKFSMKSRLVLLSPKRREKVRVIASIGGVTVSHLNHIPQHRANSATVKHSPEFFSNIILEFFSLALFIGALFYFYCFEGV